MRQVRIAPGPQSAAVIGRDIVRAPARLEGPGKFLPIVQGEGQVARCMALTAMTQGLRQIGASVPYSVTLDVWLKALVGVEHRRPDAHQASLVERKCQRVL